MSSDTAESVPNRATMSNRLASFHRPSTPSSSPAKHRPTSNPSSPSSRAAAATESTYHRKTRALLHELRSAAFTWDTLVLVDGLRAAKSLVDTRTELDNALALVPDMRPRSHLVGPKLVLMEKRIADLDSVISKLQKQFRKMHLVIENMDALLSDAHRIKGWRWVAEEPLWTTWPLEKFVSSVPEILIPYHRSLDTHTELVNLLRKHSISFEHSRDAIEKWAAQPSLADLGWNAKWEDLCAVEVERWGDATK